VEKAPLWRGDSQTGGAGVAQRAQRPGLSGFLVPHGAADGGAALLAT
jgi:hypothetical protein